MTVKAKFQRLLISLLIAISFFYGGYYYGQRGYQFEIKKNPPKIEIINKTPPDQTIDFSQFWNVWNLVSKEYLNRPVDSQKMVYGAISGMVSSLGDPYTAFLPPDLNKSINDSLNSTYQGIGAELGLKDGQLMIVSPLDGGPAKEAGIRPQDLILAIDGKSTTGLTVSEAVYKIRGTAGSTVKLTILRGNEQSKDYVLKRDVIKIDSVTWKDKGDGTAYIRISRFGATTDTEWDKVVMDISNNMKQLDAIIVDVRGNPGGYMESPVHISGDFFNDKPVLIQQSSTGREEAYKPENAKLSFRKVPALFVLIDEGSASAAEILAAALKENMNATLIGKKSFGKGTVQDVKDFTDGSGIHITTSKWLTPSGKWVHEKGIEPDIKVDLTEDDIKNNRDPQLDKAIELAKQI